MNLAFILRPSSFILRPARLVLSLLTLWCCAGLLAAPAEARYRYRYAPSPSPSPSPTVTISGRDIVATSGPGGPEAWRIPLASVQSKLADIALSNPITQGSGTYSAYGPYLLALDAAAGKITQRWRFPGAIVGLETSGDRTLKIALKSASGPAQSVFFDPSGPGPVLVTAGQLSLHTLMRKDADLLQEKFKLLEVDPTKRKPQAALAEQATRDYGEATLRDPTNPWYLVGLGRAAEDLGRSGEAVALYRRALEVPGLVFYDYTQLSSLFEAVGKRQLADRAFELGMKDFLIRGYEPELLQSLFNVLVYNLNIKQAFLRLRQMDPDRLLVVEERLFQMAPWMEGAFQTYAGTARYLEQHARISDARHWWERAAESRSQSYMGMNTSLLHLDLLFNLLAGAGIALALWLVTLGVKYWRVPADTGDLARHVLYVISGRYLSKAELLGNITLAALMGWLVASTAIEMSILANGARAPVTFLSGTLGHADSIRYLDQQAEGPARDFLLGLAHQQAGDAVKAAEYYSRLPNSARAHNNLGILAWQGSAGQAAARQEYEAALSRDPGLLVARYNVGQKIVSPRADLQEKYRPGQPLLALPVAADYRQVLSPANPNLYMATQTLGALAGQANPVDSTVYALLLTGYLFFLLTSLVALPMPRMGRRAQPLIGNRWWAGLLFPGLAPQWTVVGPALMALWSCAIVTLYYYHRRGFLGLATSMATPNLADLSLGYYPRPAFTDEWLRTVETGMIGLWLVNVVWLCLWRVVGSWQYAVDTEEEQLQQPGNG